MKRVIISDTHIGSKYYQGPALVKFLKETEYDQLILAGDIIDFIRIPMFTTRALEIADAIDFSKEVIYIVGNHDTPLRGFVGKEAFGMKFVDKYEFQEGGRSFRIEHGDTYDNSNFLHNNIVMSFISVSQSCIEHWFDVNLSDLYTDWKIKRRKLRRIWDILKRNSDVDVFIMGHSHTPEAIIWVEPDQVIKTYVNSGDWVSHKTFVEIDDGIARLKKYGNNNDQA
jgi:UDP-2,3-diacylglucosamine pyrophosphatase LpxH